MKYQDVLNTVKSRGYWRINFEPLKYNENKLTITQCKELIEKNSLHLRGWDYPHVPQRHGDDTALEPGNNYFQGWLDWKGDKYKEFWRMYQSGQFIHYLALREDWLEEYQVKNMWADDEILKSGETLGVIGATYQITEIFEFLSRLTADGLYEDGVKVSISLNNTQDRKLMVDQFLRMGFSTPKKTSSEKLTFSKKYTKEKIVSDSRDEAIKVIAHFFEKFGWNPPNIEVIKEDQKKLLEGKI